MSASHSSILLAFSAFAALAPVPLMAAQAGAPANIAMVAGNGQVVQVDFPTTVPMTIQVTDSAGIPVSGVPVTWSVVQGADIATINLQETQTDTNGMARATFFSSFIQPGNSYAQATIAASTPVGAVNFHETAVELMNGELSFLAQLLAPGAQGLTGVVGQTIPGAVKVFADSPLGIRNGQGIPDVGVRIINSGDEVNPNPAAPPARCNAPAGTVLTGLDGVATCDLVLGSTPGTYQLEALVGDRGPAGGLSGTSFFTLTITAAPVCSFTLGASSQAFTAAAASGTVTVNTTSNCGWTASSNSDFITVSSAAGGSGPGSVSFSVAANTGPARSGTLSIAGQTFTVNQSGAGAPNLSITSPTLPGAVVGASYNASLTASGGQPPYTWQIVSGTAPQGLSLTSGGTLSGTPAQTGSATFTVMVKDSAGAMQSEAFTVTVAAAGSGITITNTSFPNGIVGTPYSQQLGYSSSIPCGSPFGPQATFSLLSGSIPGLSVQIAGGGYALAGTPTTAGTFPFTLRVADACGNSGTASFSITITGSGATTTLMASVATLTFSVQQNQNTASPQAVGITSTGASVAYTVGVTTNSGGNWLAVDTNFGSTPGVFNVSVTNFQTLAPGSYTGSITVNAGVQSLIIPVTLTVTAPPPPTVTVSATTLNFNQGTNMSMQQTLSVTSSTSLPFTATSQVVTGNTSWLTVSPTSGSTNANLTVTVNSTGLPAGSYLGTVTVIANGVPMTVRVNLTVVPTTLGVDLSSVAFSYQTGGPTPASQTVNIVSPVPIPVSVTTTTAAGGNWLFATPAVNQALTSITISVNPAGLAPGGYNGAVLITPTDATITPVRIAVTLTVSAGPNPLVSGITNSASGKPGAVSPGEFVTIYGLNMAQATPQQLTLTGNNMIATTLGGTRVTFDGIPAPLVYVSATQINAIVPYEVYGRVTTQMQVSYNGGTSAPVTLAVANAAPGIFLAGAPNPTEQAAALNQDFSVNSASNPAPAGSVVTLYATGEGQTTPTGVTGTITTTTLARPLEPVMVTIAGMQVTPLYAGSAPGLAEGVMQLNIQIPSNVPRGVPIPVVLIVGSIASNAATIVVAP